MSSDEQTSPEQIEAFRRMSPERRLVRKGVERGRSDKRRKAQCKFVNYRTDPFTSIIGPTPSLPIQMAQPALRYRMIFFRCLGQMNDRQRGIVTVAMWHQVDACEIQALMQMRQRPISFLEKHSGAMTDAAFLYIEVTQATTDDDRYAMLRTGGDFHNFERWVEETKEGAEWFKWSMEISVGEADRKQKAQK